MPNVRPRPSLRPAARAAGASALALLSVGCYTYTPVAAPTVRLGAPVRVELTDVGASALTPSIGPNGRAIEGDLQELTDSVVLLSARTVVRRSGAEETWSGEALAVPRTAVAHVDRRTLSRGRTAGALAVGVAVIALVARGYGGGGSGGETAGGLPRGQ